MSEPSARPPTQTKEKGHFVNVGVFPTGINVNSVREKKCNPEIHYCAQLLRPRYAGMKLIVGRDKLDEIQANPKFQGRPDSSGPPHNLIQRTRWQRLGRRDTHFNSASSPPTYQPVVFLNVQEVTSSSYLVLLIVADAFTVTSLREGMALRMHKERYGLRIVSGQNSVLVLSNNISRSTAVGTILYLGGPACSPLGGSASVGDADYDGYWSSVTIGGGAGRTTSSTGERVSSAVDSTLVLAIGGDELHAL
ncbi:hypothetical protein EDD15DRAFT_1623154 [Pisolithus albus]|nr:hypothetical protein EDD15DRAFT_1623154 [Pisolithus albus]